MTPFSENLDLCGFPLSKMCNDEDIEEQNSPPSTLEQEHDLENDMYNLSTKPRDLNPHSILNF